MDPLLNYHPIAVHFPIALLITAFLLQCSLWVRPEWKLNDAVLLLTLLGTAGALLAGLLLHPHAYPGTLPEQAVRIFEDHEFYAGLTQWSGGVASVVKALERFVSWRPYLLKGSATLCLALCCASVSLTGYYGGELVYEHGIGIQGDHLEKKSDH